MSEARLKDNITIKGRLQIQLNGKTVVDDSNMVVDTGREWAARMLGGTGNIITRMKLGNNGGDPDPLDTDLLGDQKKWLQLTNPGGDVYVNTIEFISTFAPGEPFVVRECGLFDNESSNVLIARKAFAEVNKGINDIMSFIWTLTVV